eukprot:scaffold256059_cov26-Tisochrysis_lutea.AAC.2
MAFKLVPGGHAKGLVGGAAALTSCMVKAVEDVKALAVRANRRPPSPRVRHMQNKLSSLDLGDVQFRESAAEFEEQDPLVQPLRLSTMDKGTQQFVVSLRQLTGWGPQ